MTSATFDRHLDRIASGEPLSREDIGELSASPDVLPLGMLADALRRQRHGTRVTYLRVASWSGDGGETAAVAPAAREVLLTGTPESLEQATAVVAAARDVAGDRTVVGFSWLDVDRIAGQNPDRILPVLEQLRAQGLDGLAEFPLDRIPDAKAALGRLVRAGFDDVRLTIESGGSGRDLLWLLASELQQEFGCIRAFSPLPMSLRAFRPTTGYEDVKMVALARLAAPGIPTIQVDWTRYGPKLAQVALTFGADDVWGISASDEAPEGRRRAPVEENRRNVEAAGFEAAERDGRFRVVS
jgi:aminodeoxyfutalosine synthase